MKKKLLAVVLSVVMIAALLVPMMAISAEDAPTATVGLGEATIQAVKGVNYVVIPVNISDNTDAFFTARYQVISKEGLKPFNFRNGTFAEAYEDDFGETQKITLNISVIPDTYTDRLQIVQDAASASGTDGVKTAAGNLGAAWFTAPTEVGTYTFELVWMDGTNNKTVQYDMTVNPATVTYTVECTEHKEGEAEVVEVADCIKDGKKVVKCTVCNKVLKEEAIPALGHDLDDGVVADGVKCGETADITYSCQREGCDYTEKKTGDKVEHAMVVDEENSKAATCDEDGVEATKCSREGCDHKETKTIAKLGHNMESDQAAGEAPTCDKDGKVVDKCTRCGKVEETPIPALGHDMVADEENSKEATCYAEGVEAKKCSRCDKTETKVIPKTEHAFDGAVEVITAPTADAEGKYTVACSNEGCTEVEERTAAKLAAKVEYAVEDKVAVSFESDDAILPEDITIDKIADPEVGDDGRVTEVWGFASDLVDLEGKAVFSVDTAIAGKFTDFVVTTKDANGNDVEVEFTLENGVLSFEVDFTNEYTVSYVEVKQSPDTSDATNVVVFAIAALMAVAGLVVVGKKRFAL